MGCFAVLIQGSFSEPLGLGPELHAHGFYTTRWIVAIDKPAATGKALQAIRRDLNQWLDVRDGHVTVEMQVEEIGPGSWWRWLMGGRGFSFYDARTRDNSVLPKHKQVR